MVSNNSMDLNDCREICGKRTKKMNKLDKNEQVFTIRNHFFSMRISQNKTSLEKKKSYSLLLEQKGFSFNIWMRFGRLFDKHK